MWYRDGVTNIVIPNGFLACTQYDEATNSFVLHIINENTGQEESELDLDVKVEEDYYVNLYRESEGVQLCHYVKKGSTNNEK